MKLGDYRIEIVPDTEFRLDGGAMFGVVPRVLWERVCPPDEFNRIRLNMNCLFVETPSEKILIETGIGEKWTEKQLKIYGIFREKPFAETLFEKTGCRPEDITIVVNTHLHFDHAGGNTVISDCGLRIADFKGRNPHVSKGVRDFKGRNPHVSKGVRDFKGRNPHVSKGVRDKIVTSFPNARYFVSKREFEHAQNPHERDRASYLAENWQPLAESGQLELKPDDYEVVEGLTVKTVRGHSETMQTVCLQRDGETLYCFADLIPTTAHLPLAWIMSYDLYPTETLEFKKQILPQAVKENWICLFYHDFATPLCRLSEVEGKLKAVKIEF
jgi:glyoxylase-like metal-dependent hydrolase (beta-lactamase superfamily II)